MPTMEAAKGVRKIKRQIEIPLVTDIHFDYKLAIAAMENGADKIRINPEQYRFKRADPCGSRCSKEKYPNRVGCQQRFLRKEELVAKYHGVTAEGLVECVR